MEYNEKVRLIKSYFVNDDYVKQVFPDKTKIAKYIFEKEKSIAASVDGLRKTIANIINYDIDVELIKSNVAYKHEKQRFQDKNRINKKTFTGYARVHNAIEDYSEAIFEAIDKLKTPSTIQHQQDGAAVGILQITDTHLNELVDLSFNKYDFNIAAKRLHKYVSRATRYFKLSNVKKVLVSFTGDLINSDRRTDELLNQATNRGNATVLAIYLFEQIILDLNKNFNLDIACVSGNESRVKDEWGWSGIMATDNYDFTIFNFLKYLFRNSDGISFIIGDPTELVVNVNGANVLMLHGNCHKIKRDDDIQRIIGKYAARDTTIHLVIFGHIHSALISDFYARSGSTVGANDYSDKGLQLHSKASQNIHIVHNELDIDSIKIDLQTYGEQGYDIISELEEYNAKSSDKLKKHEVIYQITT